MNSAVCFCLFSLYLSTVYRDDEIKLRLDLQGNCTRKLNELYLFNFSNETSLHGEYYSISLTIGSYVSFTLNNSLLNSTQRNNNIWSVKYVTVKLVRREIHSDFDIECPKTDIFTNCDGDYQLCSGSNNTCMPKSLEFTINNSHGNHYSCTSVSANANGQESCTNSITTPVVTKSTGHESSETVLTQLTSSETSTTSLTNSEFTDTSIDLIFYKASSFKMNVQTSVALFEESMTSLITSIESAKTSMTVLISTLVSSSSPNMNLVTSSITPTTITITSLTSIQLMTSTTSMAVMTVMIKTLVAFSTIALTSITPTKTGITGLTSIESLTSMTYTIATSPETSSPSLNIPNNVTPTKTSLTNQTSTDVSYNQTNTPRMTSLIGIIPLVSSITSLTNTDAIFTTNPKPSNCPANSIWPQTLSGHNVTGFYCYRGTVNGTRHCKQNGKWDDIIYCFTSEHFNAVLSKISTSPLTALELLSHNNEDITVDQTIFLLSTIVNNQLNQSPQPLFNMFCKEVINNILTSKTIPSDADTRRSIGSQLLLILDIFALNLFNITGIQTIGNTIAFTVKEIRTVTGPIQAISVNNNSITLSHDIFDNLPVKIASFYYQNLSRWLLPHHPNQSLISPVLSSTNCTDCSITDLTTPVNIVFNLSNQQISNTDNLSCVYWKFELSHITLPSGKWHTNGCGLISQDDSTVICQCDHLTHFAILLSPGVPVSDENYEILKTIGFVLIPLSVICMSLTILTYVCMRSLWNIRNYIHVMLCSSLLTAQLLFVVGIEQTKYWFVCSAIAVVLQYMFLVTFMWMLMEGVVLYIALIRVFVTHPKCYIIGFTLLSYGIPGVYLLIIVPIGYLVGTDNNHTHYLLYKNEKLVACWLNYQSGFIWSFISPIVLILLVNIGFFVMAIVITKRHKNKELSSKQWIKASVSLTIVMGIGWLANVLFFTDKLLFIAYIMTVFIAGQGIIIFILYVPLSKHVREAYSKWWHNKKRKSQFFSKVYRSQKSVPGVNKYGQYNLETFDESKSDSLKKSTLKNAEQNNETKLVM